MTNNIADSHTLASDIINRHPLALDDLRTIIHHPRSLARPSAAWRPPVKALPPLRHGPKLSAAVSRRRVGPRARARIQGWGETQVPAYLIELRISDDTGAPADRTLTEAWVRALVTEDCIESVHEIPSNRTATYVWLADGSFQPVYSPPSMFDGMTAA
ncbi:hypothetical protein G7Y29_04140 [Corynebacterium qintianiae]|uniref:Uncharacterized protein n=1 Tax=Corynebacterium qintianiae TaxID=2709392 RepID=A0A7T0PFK9_9CORY|nr:hypothetical protein [Corynebacterium qintianiae]QPK83985.1 hypothetical protein G7Y29_04140 [Corynebacterium qintianiae]